MLNTAAAYADHMIAFHTLDRVFFHKGTIEAKEGIVVFAEPASFKRAPKQCRYVSNKEPRPTHRRLAEVLAAEGLDPDKTIVMKAGHGYLHLKGLIAPDIPLDMFYYMSNRAISEF